MLDLQQQADAVVATPTPTPWQPDHWVVGIHH
jgi:hypothetical protein